MSGRRSLFIRFLAAGALAAGCGGGDGKPDTEEDAGAVVCPADEEDAEEEDCFPIDESRPEGSVELGTASPDGWRPMEEEEQLVFGVQGGFHFNVHARIHGMSTGPLPNRWSECNPRTRFQGYFVDTGDSINGGACPIRYGYTTEGEDTYDLRTSLQLQFDTCLKDRDLVGRQFRLVVEVIDPDGRYAMDEATVTALAPEGWRLSDAGPAADAGAADAGPGDTDAGPGDADAGAAADAGGPDRDCPNSLP